MANNKVKVKERGREPRIIIPLSSDGPKSCFDKVMRTHSLRSKNGCILPVMVTTKQAIKSPDLDLTYQDEELRDFIDYRIGEN